MDFKKATDILGENPTHGDLAHELDVSVQLIRQARLDPSSSSHRSPPSGWEEVVARIARRRAEELQALAAALED